MDERGEKRFCCLTRRSALTWVVVFLLVYGGLLLLLYLEHLERYQRAALFAAMGLACLANFAQNRPLHCAITGPFFVLVALGLALESHRVSNVTDALLWPTVLLVVAIAFLIERRATG